MPQCNYCQLADLGSKTKGWVKLDTLTFVIHGMHDLQSYAISQHNHNITSVQIGLVNIDPNSKKNLIPAMCPVWQF